MENPAEPQRAAPGPAGAAAAAPPAYAGESVEPDMPPTTRIFVQIGVLAVILLGVLVGLWQFFGLDARDEVYRKELSLPSRELSEIQARDEGRLTRYDVADARQGHYQIPIKRAMQLLIDDPALLAPAPLTAASQPASSRPSRGAAAAASGEAAR